MVKEAGIQAGKNKITIGKGFLICLLLISILFSNHSSIAKSASDSTIAASILKITHGAHIRPTFNYGQEIASFNSLVQKELGLVMYFIDWSVSGQNGTYFDTFLPNKIQDTFGSEAPVIMLTWMPLRGRTPGCTKNYSYAIPPNDIIAGLCDNYIRNFGLALKSRPERYILRFAHEMNLYASPWSPHNFNQKANAYIGMYQHVYEVIHSLGATNVEFMWSPNYFSDPVVVGNDRNDFYPGDAYVDWIGLSGFNYYTYLQTSWKSFSDLYNSSTFNYVLKDLACRYPKPQIIAEVGSVEGPGGQQTKSAWIQAAYQDIPGFPFVRSVVWFNDYAGANPADADFRVTNTTPTGGSIAPLPASGSWTNAFRQAVSSSYYSTALPSLEEATPPDVYCGSGETIFEVSPPVVYIGLNGPLTAYTHITGMLYEETVTLSMRVPSGSKLSGAFSPLSLSAPWDKSVVAIQADPTTTIGVYQVFVQDNGSDIGEIEVHVVDFLHHEFFPITVRK